MDDLHNLQPVPQSLWRADIPSNIAVLPFNYTDRKNLFLNFYWMVLENRVYEEEACSPPIAFIS